MHRNRAHRVPFACTIALSAAFAAPLGCGDAATPEPIVENLGETQAEMNGRYVYDTDTTPFAAALIERATFYNRTVAASTAFEQCVTNTMNARYMPCGDPNQEEELATQIARVLDMVRRFNNRVRFNFDPTMLGANAGYQGNATFDEHAVNYGSGHFEGYGDWSWYGTGAGTADDYQPWNWFVGTLVHEFAHTHDYVHVGGCSCSDGRDGAPGCSNGVPGVMDEDDPTCAWVVSGGDPPEGHSWATIGEAREEYCSWQKFATTGDYYSQATPNEPSVPYILSNCAGAVVVESHQQCGKATTSGCAENELRLLASWTGLSSDDQVSPSCTCVEDPRHLVAFKTHSGHLATAAGSGGTVIQTHVATTRGPWQTFFVIDTNGGTWQNWDPVQIQSFDSHWTNANFDPVSTAPGLPTFMIGSAAGVPIVDGLWANIYRWDPVAANGRYALDDGAELVPSTYSGGNPNLELQIQDYRRERIVYLKTYHGTFVNASDSSMYLYNDTSYGTLLSYATDLPTAKTKRRSAFWLIDHNGAPLNDGDVVSFEIFRDDAWHYMSTRYATTHMRGHHSIGPQEKFVVNKPGAPAGSPVQNADWITLQAADGLWVTAVLDPGGNEIRKGGGSEGNWQKFQLRYVDQLDRARVTW